MQRRVGGRSPQRDTEERLQRALQENAQLKSQKNELEEKLKRAQTQFRRIAADWRQVQEGQSTPPPLHASPSSWQLSSGGRLNSAAASAPDPPSLPATFPSSRGGGALPSLNPNQRAATSRSPSSSATPLKRTSITRAHASSHSLASSGHQPTAGPPQRGVSEAELAACKAALAHAQLQVQQLQAAAASAAATNATSSTAAAATDAASAAAAQQEAASLRTQLQQVREELNKALFTQHQLQAQTNQSAEGLQQHLQGTNTAQQQLEAQYRASLDGLTREKQELTLQLRLMEVEKQALESAVAANAAGGIPDPADLNNVQGELHRKACEVALLNSRLQYAQGQVETMKGECARLVEELRTAATAHGDTKKALFALEHEAAALRAKSSTLSDVEVALQHSLAENVRLEEEVMKLVGSLQSCNRETEAAVRLEFQARLREVQDMRDTAERERREAERRLLNAQHDLADVRRTLESVQEDLLLYKGQVAKVEREKSVLSAQIAFAGHSAAATAGDLTEEDVHRALAVAAMRKRGGASSGGPLSMLDAVLGQSNGERKDAADSAEAKTALDLFEALNWDGDWELGQLREALATAAMDLELAETRCQQMSEQVDQYRTILRKLTEERDTLLEEGIELRGRVTHVQTIFAKQQLQAYRAVATAAATAVGSSCNDHSGLISFSLRGLGSVTASAMCRALGIADLHAPVSFFFTLDGLSDYETMISPTLHALEEVADVRFQYDDLSKDAATLATIQHTTFAFQLHCQSGEGSRLVAMAELSGVTLITARELSMEESLVLVDGTGASVGTLLVEFCCSHLALPVLLNAPLSDPWAGAVTLSTSDIKSAMVALRTVRFLRIQLFQAQGLAGSAEDNTLPQPYVFYTATCALDGGLSCVRDTVVQPFNKNFTTDPKFDVAPVDHRVVVDPSLIRFVAFGVVTFVVFDERAKDVNVNLGLVEVALRPLLESPSATITVTQPLHPQGKLSLGISWVCGV